MASLRRDDLRFLALEGLIVLFGVLAALMVEDWRQDAELARSVDAARASLNAEVARNRDELVSVESTVRARRERLVRIEDEVDGSAPFADFGGRFGGYSLPELDRSAWNRASSDVLANEMPRDYLQDAFLLYGRNDVLEEMSGRALELVFSETYHSPASARAAYGISLEIMDNQLAVLGDLIERHEAFVERYGSSIDP